MSNFDLAIWASKRAVRFLFCYGLGRIDVLRDLCLTRKGREMSETLFAMPETPSPRMVWLRDKNVRTHRNDGVSAGDECEFTGEPIAVWCAFIGEPPVGIRAEGFLGFGDTEDDAIADLAKKRGWKLWNEENFVL